MTDKLTKDFFDAFSIGFSDRCIKEGSCHSKKECNKCEWSVYVYPQINDTHYLKLVNILCDSSLDITGFWFPTATNIEELRNYVLKDCIENIDEIESKVLELFREV